MTTIATAITAREALTRRLVDGRKNTDSLFETVRKDALYERPIPERHRVIFYLGHLEAFDWNLFGIDSSAPKSFAPELDKLFAFGIDPVGDCLPKDAPEEWPLISTVVEYIRKSRRELDAWIGRIGFAGDEGRRNPSTETLLHVAIEHRLMHAETLAYMFHQLPYDRKISQSQNNLVASSLMGEMVEIPSGSATLGLQRAEITSFGWDNEFEATEIEVPAFQIDKYMVTNEQFLAFLKADGYGDSSLWSAEDWQWKEGQNIQSPAFWRRDGEQWLYRGMFEEIALPLEWPVYVSHAEASAYARWVGKSLPTEEQWHRAAYGTPEGPERNLPWGPELPSRRLGNFDSYRWDAVPVNAFPENRSAWGVVGQVGNGWEWTASDFRPLDGFEPFAFYPGYSTSFFDGDHYVLKGGSARTAAPLLRRSFRNWFQSHYQYVYAGFRCVSPRRGR